MLSKMACAPALSRRALFSVTSRRLVCVNQMAVRAFASTAVHQSPAEIEALSRVQHALLEALISCSSEPLSSSRRDAIAHELQDLPLGICPTKLDYSDVDQALLIPGNVFRPEEVCFSTLLNKVLGESQLDDETWDSFWKTFAFFYHSPRVVRCGDTQSTTIIVQDDNVLWPH